MRWSSPSTSPPPTGKPPPTQSPWPSRPTRFPTRKPTSQPGNPTDEARAESPLMRTHGAVTLIGCLAVFAAAPTLAAEPNVLRDIRLEPTGSGARLVVKGSRAPVFTVFRLAGPDRLVIDVAGGDATAIRGARDGQGPIAGINVSQFTDSTSSVGRLLVTLKDAKSYDVKAGANRHVSSCARDLGREQRRRRPDRERRRGHGGPGLPAGEEPGPPPHRGPG